MTATYIDPYDDLLASIAIRDRLERVQAFLSTVNRTLLDLETELMLLELLVAEREGAAEEAVGDG